MGCTFMNVILLKRQVVDIIWNTGIVNLQRQPISDSENHIFKNIRLRMWRFALNELLVTWVKVKVNQEGKMYIMRPRPNEVEGDRK